MKDLMSNWVGQDFWHGASAHFRHRAASRSAPLSLKVVCLMSSKLFSKLWHELQFLSSFLFQCFLMTLVFADGFRDAKFLTRGFRESKFCQVCRTIIENVGKRWWWKVLTSISGGSRETTTAAMMNVEECLLQDWVASSRQSSFSFVRICVCLLTKDKDKCRDCLFSIGFLINELLRTLIVSLKCIVLFTDRVGILYLRCPKHCLQGKQQGQASLLNELDISV